MRAELVVELLQALAPLSTTLVVDGGWGIDALVGRVTREHSDLDLALARADVDAALGVLGEHGFIPDESAVPGPPARVLLRDRRGHEVDLHPLVFDDAGNGWQELGPAAWGLYPADGITAEGTVGGTAVRCLAPKLQLRHHLGYPWRATDVHDMRLLRDHFGLRLPPPFDRD